MLTIFYYRNSLLVYNTSSGIYYVSSEHDMTVRRCLVIAEADVGNKNLLYFDAATDKQNPS